MAYITHEIIDKKEKKKAKRVAPNATELIIKPNWHKVYYMVYEFHSFNKS